MPFTPTEYFDKLDTSDISFLKVSTRVYVEYMSRIYVENIRFGNSYRIFGNSSHTLHFLRFTFNVKYLFCTYILHISIVKFCAQHLWPNVYQLPRCGTCHYCVLFYVYTIHLKHVVQKYLPNIYFYFFHVLRSEHKTQIQDGCYVIDYKFVAIFYLFGLYFWNISVQLIGYMFFFQHSYTDCVC